MKLIDALEVGQACGLSTVIEAIQNVDLHAMNMFKYEDINKEINELVGDFKASELSKETLINDAIDLLKGSDTNI